MIELCPACEARCRTDEMMEEYLVDRDFFPAKLKNYRQRKNLSIRDMARLFHTDSSSYAAYERGDQFPYFSRWVRLTKLLNEYR